ncbi:SCO family protein [Pontibacillus salicampi]|uniref:SCO family protein n=1 Tax=Pontibacillus salicampi TaxID=1449801 RepID=A0ABV6LRC8_9BACI
MRKMYLLLLPALLIVLSACNQKIEGNMSETVEPFSFTNQDRETVELEDLEGEWWVADFIFTSCDTVCPPMTNNMSQLQEMTSEKDVDVQFISFTVDPEQDNPEALKQFGNKFGADYENWSFLTGYEFDEIKTFGLKSFKTLVEDIQDSNQMMHGTSFYLVNPEGKVIKKYSGVKNGELEQIVADLQKVS